MQQYKHQNSSTTVCAGEGGRCSLVRQTMNLQGVHMKSHFYKGGQPNPKRILPVLQHSSAEITTAVFCVGREAAGGHLKVTEHLFFQPYRSPAATVVYSDLCQLSLGIELPCRTFRLQMGNRVQQQPLPHPRCPPRPEAPSFLTLLCPGFPLPALTPFHLPTAGHTCPIPQPVSPPLA